MRTKADISRIWSATITPLPSDGIEKPKFKILCDYCGSLSIKVFDPITSPSKTVVLCGRCMSQEEHWANCMSWLDKAKAIRSSFSCSSHGLPRWCADGIRIRCKSQQGTPG